MISDERLEILRMVEAGQIGADDALALLDALPEEAGLAGATVEEEAWMLTALLQVTAAIAGEDVLRDNVDEMLERVVRIVPLLSGVDFCQVYLHDEHGHAFLDGHAYPEGAPAGLRSLSLAEAQAGLRVVQEQRRPLVLDGAAQPIEQPRRQTAYALLPMQARGRFLGAMLVQYLQADHIFSPKELAILNNIANQTAVGIENVRLRQEALERARLEHEMDLAREVQVGLLPPAPPSLAGWEIGASWQAARRVGGDFYDFIALPGGALGIAIADVSDKGLPAALFMAVARSIVRATVSRSRGVAQGLKRANRLIHDDARNGTFVTVLYAVIEPRQPHFLHANAGHMPPLLLSRNGELQALAGGSIALGILPHCQISEQERALAKGDTVVLFTDGVTDALDEQGQSFGMERLCAALVARREQGVADIVAGLAADLMAFTGNRPAFDDCTVVVARYTGE